MANKILFKKILFFKKILPWTGGRSFGKKVFWGWVGSSSKTKLRFYKINTYCVYNATGLIQNFFLSQFKKKILSLVFFPSLGLLNIVPKESTSKVGSSIYLNSSNWFDKIWNGLSSFLKYFPNGSIIHFLCLKKKSMYAKAPGAYSKIIQQSENSILIQLPSKSYYFLPFQTFATLGTVSPLKNKFFYKAGQCWWLGRIPKVRGIAMNPVDHPHGGWTNGGIHPRTPKGWLTRGVKTWKKKKWSNKRLFNKKV